MSVNPSYENDSATTTSFSAPSQASEKDEVQSARSEDAGYEEVTKPHSDISSSNDVKVTVGLADQERKGPYAGMPKEVLLQYSRQAKFVWARNILTAIVILTILTLIALVIAIIVISPPCLDFWQTSPIYQIYPKSFCNEGSNEGYGNLKGIIQKLDYLNDDLGVSVLWLNPIYQSPQVDNGYDISDFRAVDPIFGTMEDMDDLIIEMHNRGMKLVMDFVPNHSSDKHEWFLASSNPRHENYEQYKDYYVWVDGIEGDPPNNWVSEFDNGTAWTWNADRGQYYFHGFFPEQPDLNLRNPAVREELKDILRFWMEKGVDGFRCDAVAFMLEAEHLRDNPVIDGSMPVNKDNIYPDYTQNYKRVHDIVAEWRALLDDYSTEPGVYRFMEVEAYADIKTTMRYYGTEYAPEGDFPMNFLLISADPTTDWNAGTMRSKILEWMENMPEGKWANWVVSNHDNSRLPSRVGPGLARCAAVLVMTLPGTPGMYYGDEIGMTDNNDIPDMEDFRDPYRTPMQWSEEENAGFCKNCTPWLPVNKNYMEGITVQNETDVDKSTLALYKTLISTRTDTVYQRGYLCMLNEMENTLIYIRELPGLDSIMVLINFDKANNAMLDLTTSYSNLPKNGRIVLLSSLEDASEEDMSFNSVTVAKESALILRFKPKGRFHESDVNSCFIHRKVCYNNALGIVQTC